MDGSVLSLAPEMAFGETVAGSITGEQIDIWAVDLKVGDEVTITKRVDDGDLAPDLLLFRGSASGSIPSVSHNADGAELSKTYNVDHDSRYVIAIRAWQERGAGDYSLSVTCNGGPCAGEVPDPVVAPLDNAQKMECVMKARRCSMDNMHRYNGAVGPARARKLVNDCLAEVTIDDWDSDLPRSCENACDDDAEFVCDSLYKKLPWFADRNGECLQEWDSCMGECYSLGGDFDSDDELYYSTEVICAHEALFNGNCWWYVNDLQICGGQLELESDEACLSYCQNTTGAFMDDLDIICEEECGTW